MSELNDKAVTRRQVVAGAVGATALLALGAGVRGAKGSGELIRPPGSVGEDEFLARCIRCDRCRSVCHLNVISVAGFSDGLIHVRTPFLDFYLGHCDFCQDCARVCPTHAIEMFDPKTVKVGVAELTERCIALRTGACRLCYDECEYKAITLDARNRPVIHADKCNGCGLCVKVCPANVLQSFKDGSQRGVVIHPINKEAQK